MQETINRLTNKGRVITLAYAVLAVEVTANTQNFDNKMDRIDGRARETAGKSYKVMMELDNAIFQQIEAVKQHLRSIGAVIIPMKMTVQGADITAAAINKTTEATNRTGNAAKEASTKVEYLAQNIKSLGAGGKVSAILDTKELLRGGDVFDQVTAKAIKFRQEFAKGVPTSNITKVVSDMARQYEGRGIDASAIRAAIPALQQLLALEENVQARRNIRFSVVMDDKGAAHLKDLSLTLKGVEQNATGTEREVARVSRAISSLARTGGFTKTQATSFVATATPEQISQMAALSREAMKVRNSLASAGVSAAQFDAELTKVIADGKNIDWEKWTALKTQINGATDAARQLAAQEREVAKLSAQLAAKGYEAFAQTIRGATDAAAAIGRAKAKLVEIGASKGPSMTTGQGAYQKEIAANAELAAQVKNLQTQMQQLDALTARLRQSGGSAMIPFIQGANSLEESIKRAQRAIENLKQSGQSMNAAQGLARARLSDQSAMARIGQTPVLPQIQTGSGKDIAADFDRVNRVVMNTRNSIQQATSAIAAFEARVNALGKNGATPGTEIGKGMRDAAEKIREADRSTKNLGQSVLGVINTIRRWVIGYVVVSQLIRLFGALKYAVIDFNSLLEKTRITLTTLFDGSTLKADALMMKLKAFARITPFQFKDLVPLTQRLLALGVVAQDTAEKKLIPTFRAIGDTVASLGGSPEIMDRIVYAFGNMVQKGKASAEEVTRQLGNANVPALKYMAQAAGVTTAEIMKRMKNGTVDGAKSVQAILYGMATDPKFKGNMAKLTQTFEGAFNNIKDVATEEIAGAFKSVFDFLSRQMQGIVKIIQTTKFRLDMKDKVDAIKEAFLALYNTIKSVIDLITRFQGTLVLLFIVLGGLAKTNPFGLILIGIARAVIGIQQLTEHWGEMSLVMKVATVAITAFGIALAAIQIAGLISSLQIATIATTTFGVAAIAAATSASAAWNLFIGNLTFLGAGPAFAGLAAGISTLALVTLPLLIAAGGIGAIMWENYKDHAARADIANHNLAISLDATGEAMKRVENAVAGANGAFADNSLMKMDDAFNKAKDNVGQLEGFIRKFGDKKMVEDIIIQSKLDPVDAGELREQMDKYIKEAERVKEALKFKVEVENEPTGWAALMKSFQEVSDGGDNMVLNFINAWNRAAEALDVWAANTDKKIADWVTGTLGRIADGIVAIGDQLLGVEREPPPPPVQATPPPQAPFSVNAFGPPVANAEQKARQKLIDDAGKYYATVESINTKSQEQLAKLKGTWIEGIKKGDKFFTTAYYKELRAAMKERERLLGDAIAQPKDLNITGAADDDDKKAGSGKKTEAQKAAEKALAAKKKLESDRLTDAAQLNEARAAQAKDTYEKIAKAAEDSAKRQIDALKGVRDGMQRLLGVFQDALSKYGVLNSPLDAIIAKIEQLTQLGPRMFDAARKGLTDMSEAQNKGLAEQQKYGEAALHARMSSDKNNGGDGSEPARQYKLAQKTADMNGSVSSGVTSSKGAQIAQRAMDMHLKGSAEQFRHYCQRLVRITSSKFVPEFTRYFGASALITMRNFQKAGIGGTVKQMGGIRPGDLLYTSRWGGKNGHAMTAGPDGRIIDNVGKGIAPQSKRPVDWVVRPGGAANVNYSQDKTAQSFGKAGGGGRVAQLNVGDGQNLMDSVMSELNNLKLGKFAELPKQFGAPIKDAEGHAARFAAQMALADRTFQNMMRAEYGDKLFGEIAGKIGELADATDRLENNLRGRAETNEIRKKQAENARKDNPLGMLQYRRRKGGDLEFLGNSKDDTQKLLAKRRELAKAEPKFGSLPDGTIGRLRAQLAALEKAYKSGNSAVTEYQKAIRDDVLIASTDKLKAYISSEKDRQKVMAEGRKFVTDSTIDTYAQARAQDLLNKKIEYRNSPEMTKLYNTDRSKFNEQLAQFARHSEAGYDLDKGEGRKNNMATARQELDRRATSLKAQIPLIAQFGGNEALLNIQLEKQAGYFTELYRLRGEGHDADASRRLASELTARADTNKLLERQNSLTRENAKTIQDMDRQKQVLEVRADLTAKLAGNEGELSRAVESQAYYFEQLNRVRDANANLSDEETRQMARELTARHNANNALVRSIELTKEVANAQRDAKNAARDVQTSKDLYAAAPYGSAELERLQKYEDAIKPLRGRAEDGEFNDLGGLTKYNDLVKAARDKVDAEMQGAEVSNRAASIDAARNGLTEAQNALKAKGLELSGSLTEAGRAQLELDAEILKRGEGTNKMSEAELAIRRQILDVLKQQAELEHNNRMDDLNAQLEANGKFTYGPGAGRAKDDWLKQQKVDGITDPDEKRRKQDELDLERTVQQSQDAADAVQAAFSAMSDAIGAGFRAAYEATGSVFDRIETGVAAMVNSIADYFLKLAEQILTTYITIKVFDAIMPGFASFITAVGGAAGGGFGAMAGMLGGGGKAEGRKAGSESSSSGSDIGTAYKTDIDTPQTPTITPISQNRTSSGFATTTIQQTNVFPNVTGPENAQGAADVIANQTTARNSRRTDAQNVQDVASYGSISR